MDGHMRDICHVRIAWSDRWRGENDDSVAMHELCRLTASSARSELVALK